MPKGGRRKVQEQEVEEEKEEEPVEEVEDTEEESGEKGTVVTATVSGGYPVIDVEEIEGVGRVTAQKLRELVITRLGTWPSRALRSLPRYLVVRIGLSRSLPLLRSSLA